MSVCIYVNLCRLYVGYMSGLPISLWTSDNRFFESDKCVTLTVKRLCVVYVQKAEAYTKNTT